MELGKWIEIVPASPHYGSLVNDQYTSSRSTPKQRCNGVHAGKSSSNNQKIIARLHRSLASPSEPRSTEPSSRCLFIMGLTCASLLGSADHQLTHHAMVDSSLARAYGVCLWCPGRRVY
eukprot:1336348-Amorphochlora_amoeboformis.AAC.1